MDMLSLLESIDIDNKETTELLKSVSTSARFLKAFPSISYQYMIFIINNTTQRYKRYIEGIDDWKLGGINYSYIPQLINKFFSIPADTDDNIKSKISLMKSIDDQMINIITKHNIL